MQIVKIVSKDGANKTAHVRMVSSDDYTYEYEEKVIEDKDLLHDESGFYEETIGMKLIFHDHLKNECPLIIDVMVGIQEVYIENDQGKTIHKLI